MRTHGSRDTAAADPTWFPHHQLTKTELEAIGLERKNPGTIKEQTASFKSGVVIVNLWVSTPLGF